MSWMYLTTTSLWQRCRNINTYGKISANNSYNPVTGQIVLAELNMHDSVYFDDVMEGQFPQWNHWILWSHMHSDQNYVIKKYSKTLRLGKLLSLMIFFSCSWRWVNNGSWAWHLFTNELCAVPCMFMDEHGRLSSQIQQICFSNT